MTHILLDSPTLNVSFDLQTESPKGQCPPTIEDLSEGDASERTIDTSRAPKRLLSEFKEVAAQWHPTRNGERTPDQFVAGSNAKAWWVCPSGADHEWEMSLRDRTGRGHGCPFCSGRRVSVTNSLASQSPAIAAQWHPTKNGTVTPDQIVAGSHSKAWWACPEGADHEWEMSLDKRTSRKHGCPFCSGRRASLANSLASQSPTIAAQWHKTRNGAVTPDQVVAGSTTAAWWACPNGQDHEWKAAPANRTTRGQGCPFCRGRRVSLENSLSSRFPDIAAEWHPTKNGDVTPDAVVAGSGAKAWWICPAGPDHEWEATLDKRTRVGSGCPRCNKGWTASALRAFIEGIRPHLATLSPAELWTLCMQNGLLRSVQSDFGRLIVSGRLTGSDLDEFLATRDLDDLQADAEADSLAGELTALGNTALDLLDSLEHHLDDPIRGALPEVSIAGILASSELLLACADSEAAEYLVAARVALLWKAAYRDATRTDMETSAPLTGPYQERIRAAFRAEFDAALALPVPAGWRFTVNGEPASPNLMQRHVAVQVRDRRSVGNWSGTGAGKTVSAVLAARSIGSNLTVIVCPNSTIAGWTDTITRCFPDQRIATKTLTPTWTAGAGPQWLIVNYETLQAPDAEAKLVTFLDTHTVDMLVIDEVHFAKQRASQEEASTRRRRLNGLRSLATASNPALAVLAMSATPVVNDLFEGRSMLELVEGVELNDVRVNPTIQNAVGIHQRLVRAGTRWMPEYSSQLTISEEIIDAGDYVDDVRMLGKSPSPSDLDKALLPAKLETIVQHATAGGKTLIYTEFVTGIVEPLREALEAVGLRVGEYTGTDKTGFDKFVGYHLIGGRHVPIVEGDQVDVLIGSSAVGTGVDGLQHAANRLIFATLPWTSANFQQIVGRVHRQGQMAATVDVIIPITQASVGGETWSWCRSRMDRIAYKRSLADAAVDGILPEGRLVSATQAAQAVADWLDRLSTGELHQIERTPLNAGLVSTPAGLVQRLVRFGAFASMNARWNSTQSSTTHSRLLGDPGEWFRYHALYREARASWSIVPADVIAGWLARRKPGQTIADLGCGEMLLANADNGRNTVRGFDHVAADSRVTVCDIASVPLKDASVDIAVLCLSLMGANSGDYLTEARRILYVDGSLWIAETVSHFGGNPDRIRDALSDYGFHVTEVEYSDTFVFVKATRLDTEPVSRPRRLFA